jgi:hypothetical protein
LILGLLLQINYFLAVAAAWTKAILFWDFTHPSSSLDLFLSIGLPLSSDYLHRPRNPPHLHLNINPNFFSFDLDHSSWY